MSNEAEGIVVRSEQEILLLMSRDVWWTDHGTECPPDMLPSPGAMRVWLPSCSTDAADQAAEAAARLLPPPRGRSVPPRRPELGPVAMVRVR